MDFSHQISFIGPVPNFTLPSLNLFVTVSQRQLSAVLPQGNTHTPLTLFFPSKKLIDLNYGTPAVWVITLFPYISMIPYNRSFPVAPRFPVPPAYFPSCVHWCRGSSAGRSAVLLSWRSPLKFLWDKYETNFSLTPLYHSKVHPFPSPNLV